MSLPSADNQQAERASTETAPFDDLASSPERRSSQVPSTYLSTTQHRLLLAALSSQAIQPNSLAEPQAETMSAGGMFQSPQDVSLDGLNADYTPDLDFDGDNSFDFDDADLGGDMIGALSGTIDHAEKRKDREDSAAPDGIQSKRQETEDGEKAAKKPGRKPLTTEPTTKRKAQNRAAQRAFRERKEQHVKDLETKVTELTKEQELEKHEKGLLKAQVERLQVELREYRKRLSLNGARSSGSPPLAAFGVQRSNSGSTHAANGGFQFDFPKFGALPGSQMFGNENGFSNGAASTNVSQSGRVEPPSTTRSYSGSNQSPPSAQSSRHNSQSRVLSPKTDNTFQTLNTASNQLADFDPAAAPYSTTSNMHGFASTLPQMKNTAKDDTFGGLFSPSILKSVSRGGSIDNSYFVSQAPAGNPLKTTENGYDLGGNSTAGLNRAFQFNSNSSNGDSASPASSMSQWNNGHANSSCGTSPEPSHGSPASKEKSVQTFGETLNSLQNPTQSTNQFAQPSINDPSFLANADFNVPSLDSFDPVLFGDYRDSNDAIVGGGDFTGGFFNDALDNSPPFDYGSPSNLFGILQSPQQSNKPLNSTVQPQSAPSKKCLEDCDKLRDGGDDDYGLPDTSKSNSLTQHSPNAAAASKLISCNNIWNQLQANPDFQDGRFDLDSLCSELRSKARCSESGVMVDQDHVDAALRKLGKKDEKGVEVSYPHLMFEQQSWDNVLQKMGNRGDK